MPLGDSITRGEGASASLIPGGYRDPLAHELTTADISFQFVGDWDSNPTDFLTATGNTGNSGHGGWRIDQIQNNITNWQEAFTPDVVLLHIGTNDILQGANLGTGGFDTSKAISRLNTLLNTIYTNNSSVSVVLSTIIPVADSRDSYVKNYNALLSSTVVPYFTSLGHSIILADNYKNFINDAGGYRSDLYSDGAIHPNAAGYQKMADTWFSSLQNIPVPPDQPPAPEPPATLRFTAQVSAGNSSFDSHIRTNLVRSGTPTLDGITVSHDPSIPGTFKTSGLNDGSATANSNLTYYGTNEPTGTLPTVVTFTLKGSVTGYDITSVESLAGWKDSNIGDQTFRLLLSITGGAFLDYGTYSAKGNLGDFASLVTVTDESGIIASGVTAIRIIYLNPNATQGGNGGTVVRELQVFGAATAVPEPSTIALFNIGAVSAMGIFLRNHLKYRKKNKAPSLNFADRNSKANA
jgi:lysophospholipase L1-like esterase